MQRNAETIQNHSADCQPKLSTNQPVPIPEIIAPKYPKIPQNPVAAAATFFDEDSTAQSPPMKINGPAVNNPIPERQT